MNKNPQKQRMNIQLNQIRSILNDFRKTKYKCVQLAKTINMQMPKEEHFKNVQKTTMRKMDLLDITGLVSLKNQLVRALTDLFEIERELRYKKEKFDARKLIMEAENQEAQYVRRNQVQSAIQSPRNVKPTIIQTNVRSIVSEPKKQVLQVTQPKQKSKNLEIPLYRSKNETNQNKLDRISKYIASLKRNMKLNSDTLGYKWKIKEFLLEDPNYVKIRNQLERYMMREQELDHIFAKAVQKGVKQCIKKSEIVESTTEYKLVKVYKHNPNKSQSTNEWSFSSQIKQNIKKRANISTQIPTVASQLIESSPRSNKQAAQRILTKDLTKDMSFESPKVTKQESRQTSMIINSPLRNLSTKIEIQTKAEEDFNQIKKELEKSNESYIEMLKNINQTVEKGSEKLIQLREKRKKKFEKDDDIWDELDKI